MPPVTPRHTAPAARPTRSARTLAAPRLRTHGSRIVTALDVGTSKVVAMVAAVSKDAPPRILGTGIHASSGLKNGLVADMEGTEAAIRTAVMHAEEVAHTQVESVLVNLGAGNLESDIRSVGIPIDGHQITDSDVERLLVTGYQRIAEDLSHHSHARALLHAEPTLYTVDGLPGVTNPRGFYADQLSVDIHAITAAIAPCRNLDLAVRNAHLDVETIVASGVASSEGVLNGEERELGVAMIEIGAGVTTIALHLSGMLAGLATIPMGAGDITVDIASALATPRADAERLKTLKGAATSSPRDNHDMLDVPQLDAEDGEEPRHLPRSELIAIIRSRLDMLFREVEKCFRDMGFQGPHGHQVVLTGGGAELRGIADYAQTVLKRNVRIGRPRGLVGLSDTESTAAFATVAGLLLYASHPRPDLARVPAQSGKTPGSRSAGPFARLFKHLKNQI